MGPQHMAVRTLPGHCANHIHTADEAGKPIIAQSVTSTVTNQSGTDVGSARHKGLPCAPAGVLKKLRGKEVLEGDNNRTRGACESIAVATRILE